MPQLSSSKSSATARLTTLALAATSLAHGSAHAQCLPSFAAPVSYPSNGTAPVAVNVADLNADGKADLLLLLAGSSAVSVRLGSGNGAFGAPANFSVGNDSTSSPLGMAVGDLNSDGVLDVATANLMFSNVTVRFGNGSGGFGGSTHIPTAASPRAVAIGDFNNDGRTDLATGNSTSVSVLLANGTGGYAAPVNYDVGGSVYALVPGDLNGDGRTDLVTAT